MPCNHIFLIITQGKSKVIIIIITHGTGTTKIILHVPGR